MGLFSDPRLKSWAESLYTMTWEFRNHYVGMDWAQVKLQIGESWHGCQVGDVNPQTFAVRHLAVLEPFIFYFEKSREGGNEVAVIRTEANAPYSNIVLLTNSETTNFVLKAPPEALNKHERQLCDALKTHGKIPGGHVMR